MRSGDQNAFAHSPKAREFPGLIWRRDHRLAEGWRLHPDLLLR